RTQFLRNRVSVQRRVNRAGRGCVVRLWTGPTSNSGVPCNRVQRVRHSSPAGTGSCLGVDRQLIVKFEKDLANDLYKLWNRSRPAVTFVHRCGGLELPNGNGGTRPLSTPTVGTASNNRLR